RFDLPPLLIDDAHADATVIRQVGEELHASGPRRGQLEKQGADVHTAQQAEQRPVVAGQGDALVGRPVAAAYVHAEARSWQPGYHLVDQRARELELTLAIALLTERAAHEASRVLGAGEHDFGQHRLVELHEGDTTGKKIVDLLAHDAHDVFGQVLTRAI